MSARLSSALSVLHRFSIGLLLAAFLVPLVHSHAPHEHPTLHGHDVHDRIHGSGAGAGPADTGGFPPGCGDPAAAAVFTPDPASAGLHAHLKIDFLHRQRTKPIPAHAAQTHVVPAPHAEAPPARRLRRSEARPLRRLKPLPFVFASSDLPPPVA